MVDPSERYASAAVAWALERVGDDSYALRCLSFVEDAYERANAIEVFGGDTAREPAAREQPRLVGWAPRERVLEGHRVRSWADG